MRGVDRHLICFFVFAGTQKDTRDVGGEGAVFAGSKKCTRDGFVCCHPERSEGSRWLY